VSTSRKTLSQRLAWTLKHRWNQYIRIPYRRWKYVSRVFESEN
jgi:hypothetical protein